MGKIAFVFSGQGAQYSGMGKALCSSSAAAKAVYDMADGVREGTSNMCFEGSAEDLNRTVNTQPCVFTADLAAARALEEKGIKPVKFQSPIGGKVVEMTVLYLATIKSFNPPEGIR